MLVDLVAQFIRVRWFIVRFHQQVRQQFFALDFELGHSDTDVEQLILIQLGEFFFQLADRGGFHIVSKSELKIPNQMGRS